MSVSTKDHNTETFTASLRKPAMQMQEVSARLETSKPAAQVVNNP